MNYCTIRFACYDHLSSHTYSKRLTLTVGHSLKYDKRSGVLLLGRYRLCSLVSITVETLNISTEGVSNVFEASFEVCRPRGSVTSMQSYASMCQAQSGRCAVTAEIVSRRYKK